MLLTLRAENNEPPMARFRWPHSASDGELFGGRLVSAFCFHYPHMLTVDSTLTPHTYLQTNRNWSYVICTNYRSSVTQT